MARQGQLARNSPVSGLLCFSSWAWGLGWTAPCCSSTGRIWGDPARVSGPDISKDRTQCTALGWESTPSPFSVEAVSRTSSENSVGFLGAAGTTSVPGSGDSGEGSWPAFTLSPSCSLGSGRGIPGTMAWPPGHAQAPADGFLLHLPGRNPAVQGLRPKAGGKIPLVEVPLDLGSGRIWAGGWGRWGCLGAPGEGPEWSQRTLGWCFYSPGSLESVTSPSQTSLSHLQNVPKTELSRGYWGDQGADSCELLGIQAHRC